MRALTFDVDWAPDFILHWCCDRLLEARIPSTWFLTHQTPVLERFRKHPELFELGIHPAFNDLLQGRGGASAEERVRALLALVPEATGVRGHSLCNSSNLTALYSRCGLRYEANLLLPAAAQTAPIFPAAVAPSIMYVCSMWEDDVALAHGDSLESLFDYLPAYPHSVLNFHPIHWYLNSANLAGWDNIKGLGIPLTDLRRQEITPFINSSLGIDSLLSRMFATHFPGDYVTVREIVQFFQEKT